MLHGYKECLIITGKSRPAQFCPCGGAEEQLRAASCRSFGIHRPDPIGALVQNFAAVGRDPQPPLAVDRDIVGRAEPAVFARPWPPQRTDLGNRRIAAPH